MLKTDFKSRLNSNRPVYNRGKVFEHSFVEFEDFEARIIDGKRYYFAPDGGRYPSVTTILGEKKDKTHLERWIKNIGHERAEQIKVQAGNRGTAIHTICEDYLLNKDLYPEDVMPSNIMTFSNIKPILDKRIGKIYAVEAPLYSKQLNTAGRTDCIADFDGVISIIDFKTSLKPKKEEWIEDYFLQTTCYSLMAEALSDLKIPQIVVIISVDEQPEPQVFIKDKYLYVEKVLQIFG